MKKLINFIIPVPKDKSEITRLYEGIKGLGYKMFSTNPHSYSYYEGYGFGDLGNIALEVGFTEITSQTIYPSFEAFKEAHEALNREGIPEKHSYTKGFPDLEEFLNKFSLTFEDFMEIIYSYNGGGTYTICDYVNLKVSKYSHDQQGNNYAFEGTIKDVMSKEEWEFKIVDGNCSGTEVINFEKTVDKEESKEDNTMARAGSENFNLELNTSMTQSYAKARTYDPNAMNEYIKENTNLNKTEEKTMRRVVTVKLINPNTAIEASDALVGNFGEYVTDDSNEVLIQEIIMEGDVQDLLDLHNKYLTETVDQSILKATGQEVMLRPVRLKDLKWIIKE